MDVLPKKSEDNSESKSNGWGCGAPNHISLTYIARLDPRQIYSVEARAQRDAVFIDRERDNCFFSSSRQQQHVVHNQLHSHAPLAADTFNFSHLAP